jgi:hypothetical protein
MSDLIKRDDVMAILVKHNAEVAAVALSALIDSMTGDQVAKGGCVAFTLTLDHATQIKNEVTALKAVTQ